MSLITAAVKCTAVWWIMPDETGFQGSIQKVNITLLIQEVRESDVHAINITLLCEELANSCNIKLSSFSILFWFNRSNKPTLSETN